MKNLHKTLSGSGFGLGLALELGLGGGGGGNFPRTMLQSFYSKSVFFYYNKFDLNIQKLYMFFPSKHLHTFVFCIFMSNQFRNIHRKPAVQEHRFYHSHKNVKVA